MISGCAPQNTAVAGGERWRLLVVPMLFVGHPMLLIGLACAAHSSCRCRTVVMPVPLFLQMNRSVLEYAVRCMCRCSALRCPMERAAHANAARCVFRQRRQLCVGRHGKWACTPVSPPAGSSCHQAARCSRHFCSSPLGTQAGPSFPSSAKAEARHMRWHGLASWVFSAGQSGCLCGVWGCVRAP